MDDQQRHAGSLDLLGGRLSLEFANTVDWHASDQPVEYLTSYAALVAWSRHAGTLDERQAAQLLDVAARRGTEADALRERAIRLREAVYRIFVAVSAGLPAPDDDLGVLNVELSRMMANSRIVPAGHGFDWDWAGSEGALDRVLWPVVRDAADLLTSGDLARVGHCADDRCGWLFFDTSRNRSRRWCSMDDCGNRAKARRHYERSRASVEG